MTQDVEERCISRVNFLESAVQQKKQEVLSAKKEIDEKEKQFQDQISFLEDQLQSEVQTYREKANMVKQEVSQSFTCEMHS